MPIPGSRGGTARRAGDLTHWFLDQVHLADGYGSDAAAIEPVHLTRRSVAQVFQEDKHTFLLFLKNTKNIYIAAGSQRALKKHGF